MRAKITKLVPCVFLGAVSACLGGGTEAETNLALNRAVYQSGAANFSDVGHLATDGSLQTFWKSVPGATSWVYVDLGRSRPIDKILLHWQGKMPDPIELEFGDGDGQPTLWRKVGGETRVRETATEIRFGRQQARYVRVSLSGNSETKDDFRLSEFEVIGPAAVLSPAPSREPSPGKEGTFPLDGLAWKVQNADFVPASAATVSASGFDDRQWIPALVPGTVLASYLKAGAIPDFRYGNQQTEVSEDFFNRHDFWYRAEFVTPRALYAGRVSLNFDGINWKSDVFLNGVRIGETQGVFLRSQIDVTGRLRADGPNVLAVRVHPPAHPGPTNQKSLGGPTHNGGVLGLDSPTFVSSIGWNWLPSIRGRETGIWNHVFLRPSGEIEIHDPFIRTDLSGDLSRADLTLRVGVTNRSAKSQVVTLHGTIGEVSFDHDLALQGGESQEVILDRKNTPQLSLPHPKVWWPNGYGAQPLYRLHLEAKVGGAVSDQRDIQFGVRSLSYDTSGGSLQILVNGHRILCNGGNWGMDEGMLLYDASDYDAAVRLHRDMNLVMIRNWVGMVGRDEFYDACDKYGVLVWNDFWLANPADGADPDDHALFIRAMRDKVLQIRNHPSLALYCGRNEGMPPVDLDAAMASATAGLDGTRFYIPDSKSGVVTGGGPYEPKRPDWYFQNRGTTFHSELGIVCVPPLASLKSMMPEADLWPIGKMWAIHDFYQPRCEEYVRLIAKSYGPSDGVGDFCAKAQMLNLETAKAMLEAWRSNRGGGGLVWMSQAAWPSLICQLYDYDLVPTAAYFGIRKACEPLHILWNAYRNEVQVANDTLQSFGSLQAEVSVYDLDGRLAASQSAKVAVDAGTVAKCFPLDFAKSRTPVRLIRARLSQAGKMLSENFYWTAAGYDYRSMGQMPRIQLVGKAQLTKDGKMIEITIHNPTNTPALSICLSVRREEAIGKPLRPYLYQDNYFCLLPQETKTISIRPLGNSLDWAPAEVSWSGWNIDSTEVAVENRRRD